MGWRLTEMVTLAWNHCRHLQLVQILLFPSAPKPMKLFFPPAPLFPLLSPSLQLIGLQDKFNQYFTSSLTGSFEGQHFFQQNMFFSAEHVLPLISKRQG